MQEKAVENKKAKEQITAEKRVAVYDIEPDRKDTPADIKALPRKLRFYHGKIAARSLNSGASTLFLYTRGTEGGPVRP